MDQSVDEAQGISDAVLDKLSEKANQLTAARKQRGKAVPEGLAKTEDIGNYKQVASHTGIHSTGTPGVTALDVQVFSIIYLMRYCLGR